MDYDVEMEKLKKFLFPEGLGADYQENSEFIAYLSKLGSLTAEQFVKEEKALDEEKLSIDIQTKNLTKTNYKTFIQTADCSRAIYTDVCSIENNVREFIDETPKLLNECENFVDVSQEIKEKRRRNNLILSSSAEILQILEIPQFMNTCIQNELYEEALLLPAFIKRLASKHGDIPLINCIVRDVEKSWWELQRHLLRQLTTDISLPKCLQIIGYLRRMNIFSETELRLQFLQARGSWFDSHLAAIPSENSNQHLSLVIDVTRVNIFSVATQYKAIFTDDEVVTNSKDLKNNLFFIWLNTRVNDFIRTVESDLVHCPASSLDLLLGQCMYFGQSFGRIGADFRSLVVKPFVKTVENNFQWTMRKVNDQFNANMNKFILPKSISSASIDILRSEMEFETPNLMPPVCLLDYYPLVEYCNGILAAFNELRYCNPYPCAFVVTTAIQNSLENVSLSLFSYFEKENLTWFDTERDVFSHFCNCYSEKLLPFIQDCLSTLYNPQVLTKCFGFTVAEMEDENVVYLNVVKIREYLYGSCESATNILPT